MLGVERLWSSNEAWSWSSTMGSTKGTGSPARSTSAPGGAVTQPARPRAKARRGRDARMDPRAGRRGWLKVSRGRLALGAAGSSARRQPVVFVVFVALVGGGVGGEVGVGVAGVVA